MNKALSLLWLQLVIMFFFSGALQAQKNLFEGGVHVGGAMSKLTNQGEPNGRNYFFSFVPNAGINLSLGLNDHFSLISGLDFIQIRSEREGLMRILPGSFHDLPSDVDYYSYFQDKIRLDYLEVPFLLRGTIGDRLKGYLVGGAFIGINLGGNYKSSGKAVIYTDKEGKYPVASGSGSPSTEQILNSNRNITGDIRPINVGGCEGIGMIYTIGRNKLQLEGRYSFGLTNIWRDKDRNGVNKTDNLVLQLMLSVPL